MIDVRHLTYAIGGRILLDDVSFCLPTCQTIGVVGANGCGKSTLFRLILGDIFAEKGEILKPSDAKIVTIRQEIRDFSKKLLDFVLEADVALMQLRQRSEIEHDGTRLAEIFEAIEAIDGYNAEVRAATILSGLGFSNDVLENPLSAFSGGWQIRAAIAATLFAPSDILLLDEPTNHLDFETTLWLRSYLKKIKPDKTILIVSHDRMFLNTLCDKILHLPSGTLYTGNYDTFVVTRANQQAALERRIEKQTAVRQHLQSFVDRFRYKATKAKQAQSRLKMLEKMEQLPRLDRDYSVKFSFPNPTVAVDRELIRIKNGSVGYGEHVVLKNLNLKIDMGDRIALLGANGNGKSTLVKVLADRLPLLEGTMTVSKKLNRAYFSQQLTDQLDIDKTPYEFLSSFCVGMNETAVRSQLARFGLTQQKADTLIRNLSGGEKTRLLLAITTRHGPHVLILDEPTNHLDIEAKEALVDALNGYEGAVVLVSHDFFIVESVCEQLWLVKDQKCVPYDGDLEHYVQDVLNEKRQTKGNAKSKSTSGPNNKQRQNLEKQLVTLEQQLLEKQQQKAELERRLNEQYSEAILQELTELSQHIEQLEANWLELSEQSEA